MWHQNPSIMTRPSCCRPGWDFRWNCVSWMEKFGGNENNAAEFAFLNLDNMDVLIKET